MQATTHTKLKTPRHKVADGIYPATLENYQPMNTNNGLRWQFVFSLDGVKTPDGQNVTLQRTTSPSLAPKSHRRTIVEALLRSTDLEGVKDLFGNPAADYESVTPNQLVGVPCTVHVENQKNKLGIEYSNIENVFPKYQRQEVITRGVS